MSQVIASSRRTPRQRGAYAVEYALIFPVFFLLFYGTLAYGLAFSMRLGLQQAAEEGVRAGLRYQTQLDPDDRQITLREAAAEARTRISARWISAFGPLEVVADICPLNVECLPGSGGKLGDELACGESFTDGCQLVVSARYHYRNAPVMPELPGFGLVMPEVLQGRARALIDGRTLAL